MAGQEVNQKLLTAWVNLNEAEYNMEEKDYQRALKYIQSARDIIASIPIKEI